MSNNFSPHIPVLPVEFQELLDINPNGIYIDGTFGRGGHSQIVLDRLSRSGRLIAFDRDLDAVACAEKLAEMDSRVEVFHSEFSAIPSVVPTLTNAVDGVFFDLGVSSPQLLTSARGFSFRSEGPLDMRMNQRKGFTAEDWVNSASETEIAEVLWKFGEERYSRRIAKKIAARRKIKAIKTTTDLADIIRSSTFGSYKIDAATRSFQAIRIFINQELAELQSILESVLDLLSKGGRMLVISFHSIEDRLVKHRFRELSRAGVSYGQESISPPYRLLTKKPIRATREEVRFNRRARSARLRGIECLI